MVLRFSGAQSARARSAVVAALEDRVDLVDVDAFSDALEGAQGPTRPDRIAATCRRIGVDAVVEGAMSRIRRAWGVEIIVRNCDNGEKVTPGGRATYSMRNLGGMGAIRGSIWSRIGSSVMSCRGGGGAVASRSSPRPAERGGAATSPRSSPPPPRPSSQPRQCLFEEDEPPEGFPGHGDWVRRRNEYLNRCERERVAAEQRRVREEQERRRRAEEARLADERRQRDEAERRRREADQQRRREEEERRAEEDRWRREQEERRRVEERRRQEAERREREETARREREALEAREASTRRSREEAEQRERASEIEQRVAAYRERLRREREQNGTEDGDDASAGYEEPGYDRGGSDRDRGEDYDSDPDRGAGREDEPSGVDRDRGGDGSDSPDSGYDDDHWYERDRSTRDDTEDRSDTGRRPRSRSTRAREGEGEGEGHPAQASALGRTRPTILNLGAGLAFMNRSMSVEVLGSPKPRTYSAPGYPELTVGVEFFPIALASPTSGASGLGVFGLYRRHLYLQTSGPTDLGETIDVATGEQELLLGAMFRTQMGRSASSPLLTMSAGYGYFAFELDPVQMSLLRREVQMPTMIYNNLVVQAAIAIPVTRSGIAIEFGGQYRYVVDVGQAARDLFGDQTGGGNGFGARVGLSGNATFVTEGLHWSLTADYLVFTTEFHGAPLDGEEVVDGFPAGTDQYIRALFLAAYRFR